MPSSRSSSRALMKRPGVYPVLQKKHVQCSGCSSLPVGSMEVAAILLVLVFSLSTILVTSVYATRVQSAKIRSLEQKLEYYRQ